MSEAKHTPGDWQYDPDTRVVYGGPDGDTEHPTICDVLDTTEGLEGDCPQADANGHLIAAAPAMFTELSKLVEWLERLAAQAEQQAAETRHVTIREASEADAKNYRASTKRAKAILAKAKGQG